MVSFFNPENRASAVYTRMKQHKAEELGIVFDPIELNPKVTAETIFAIVNDFNKDPRVDGVMFQLPLPDHLQPHKGYLLSWISPEKDVDGLTGKGQFLPATVKGVLSILEDEGIGFKDGLFAVVGSEGTVGKALLKKLKEENAKVLEVDQKIPGSSLEDLKDADIIISCAGEENLIKPQHIRDGAVLIDVGLGDFDPACYKKAEKYTPKIGGVGPMTVVSLMENVFDAAKRRFS